MLVSRYKTMRIRTKLIMSYFIACFIPLLISIMLMAKYAENKLEDSAREFASAYSAQITDGLNTFIQDYNSITESLLMDGALLEKLSNYSGLSTSEKVEYMQQANRMMARAGMLMKQAKSISFYSASGDLYTYGLSNDIILGSELLSEEWFQNLIGKDETVSLTEIHEATYKKFTEDKTRYVTFSRKIYNYEYQYIGTLLVDFEPDDLININKDFSSAEILKDIRILIWNQDDKLIFDTDLENAGNLESIHLQPSDELIVYSSSTEHKNLNVKIIIPRKNLRVRSEMINMFAIISALISLMTVAAISLFVSRDITKPILNLQRQMNLAESGDYEIAIDNDSSVELQELTKNYNNMITKIKVLINEVYLADIEQKNAKLLALQTQINPHMLYNTLEAIRMKALTQGDHQVAEMVKALARMFRNMLSTKVGHSLREEVLYTQDYMMLQNLRFPGMLRLDVNIPDFIMECESLPMILQPIVENAIIHGFKDRRKILNILISGYALDDKYIVVTVENDGQSLEKSQLDELCRRLEDPIGRKKGQGKERIGLMNIAERIRLSFGDTYGVKVSVPEQGGVSVSISLPQRYLEIRPEQGGDMYGV